MAVTGTYVLLLRADADSSVTVGALGRALLHPGWYVYVGSAFGPGGLTARLRRHGRTADKSLHWHVDYLRAALTLLGAWVSPGDCRRECQWAHTLLDHVQAEIPLVGAGASDCDCPAHFLRIAAPDAPPDRDRVASRLQGAVAFLTPEDMHQDPIRIPTGTALTSSPRGSEADDASAR